MKISEKLAIIKRQEGELVRLYSLRESIAKQTFKETAIVTESDTSKDVEKRRGDFLDNKKAKVEDVEKKIKFLTQEIIDGKNTINKKNVEIGIDKKLAEIKYIRIELSKLMKITSGGYLSSFDAQVFEELNLAEKIKKLEEQKQKLDNEIQRTNWTTEL